MAVDMFIKIGSLKGESADHKHKEEIDVLSWSWGLENHAMGHVAGGSGTGKVNVQDINFVKYIDKSTPDLVLACAKGTHIPEAKLTVRKAGNQPLEYLVITLSDVFITNLHTGGAHGQDRLTENISLNFAKVKVDYKEQLPSGLAGASPTMTWDVRANTPA